MRAPFKLPRLIVALACCAALHAHADDAPDRLVDLNRTKIVIMADTQSKDGRYAVGWTLRPLNKKVAPVDWSLWSADDWNALPGHYHMEEDSGEAKYTADYFLVDLQEKKTLALPADYKEMHPSAYNGSVDAAWSDEVGEKHHGVFEFNYVGAAGEIFLVSLSGNKMELIESDMDSVVDAQLPKHTSLDDYTITYRLTEDVMGRKLQPFHGAYADIIFGIGIRHDTHSPRADGILTLRLADGKVTHVTRTDAENEEDEAIRDNPELGRADAELNRNYLILEKALHPAEREALKKSQRAWVMARNKAVEKAGRAATDGATETALRDKAQLDFTYEREAELRIRIERLEGNDP
ncbi:MAG TPA: lysozyme inhibitor LprI family protein [Chthoniobacteraceae bacterium]|nr:lysozyme inhibitor LprI family protein [Chthoniobacteraceae bacterium]